jgi:hypothetical protein
MKRVSFWHLKALGFCNRQMRVWCREHDYSWRRLRTEGIDADYLLSIDNSAMSQQAVAFAESTGWSVVPVESEHSVARCV